MHAGASASCREWTCLSQSLPSWKQGYFLMLLMLLWKCYVILTSIIHKDNKRAKIKSFSLAGIQWRVKSWYNLNCLLSTFLLGFLTLIFQKLTDTLLSSLISPTQLSYFHCSEEETVTSPLRVQFKKVRQIMHLLYVLQHRLALGSGVSWVLF